MVKYYSLNNENPDTKRIIGNNSNFFCRLSFRTWTIISGQWRLVYAILSRIYFNLYNILSEDRMCVCPSKAIKYITYGQQKVSFFFLKTFIIGNSFVEFKLCFIDRKLLNNFAIFYIKCTRLLSIFYDCAILFGVYL